MDDRTKRRVLVPLQRYVLNPPVKLVTFLGLLPGYVLIETVGRKTGRARRTVVGAHREDDTLWIVAEQGRHAGYVRNLEAHPRVRVRLRGRWREGTAHVVEDDDPRARLKTFDREVHARSVVRFGTELASVRIDLDDACADGTLRR